MKDFYDPDRQLQILCDILNDDSMPERRDAFRAMVTKLPSGKIPDSWWTDNRELWRAVELASQAWQPYLVRDSGGLRWKLDRLIPQTTEDRRSKISELESRIAVLKAGLTNPSDILKSPTDAEQAREMALPWLAMLLLNEKNAKLRRDPCERCGNFYIGKRKNKRFCSRRCANIYGITAKAEDKHAAMLKTASKFLPLWNERKKAPLAMWVVGRVNKQHGTKKTKKWFSRNLSAIQQLIKKEESE